MPAPRGLLALFATAACVNAAVLFTVEPLFGRLVLPLLGGTSAVWSTCLVFYQAALSGGYLYAHLGSRYLGSRRFAAVHLALAALACTALPLHAPEGWTPPTTGTPVLWLLGLLAASLGLPFFVLSAGAPLLQRWYADVATAGADPFVLYAASNGGSLVALLAYPLVLEPTLTLRHQALGWSVAFGGLVLLLGVCAWRVWRAAPAPAEERARAAAVRAARATAGQRLRWIALSAVPSSLLLGTTAHLTTDVAPIPLLWVVPLALYLTTFIVAFGAGARRTPDGLLRATRFAVIPLLLVSSIEPYVDLRVALVWTLSTFALVALLLHIRLAAARPEPARLTEYYAWLSVGGLLGGVFNSLVAPVVFRGLYEYPLALVAALVLLADPGAVVAGASRHRVRDGAVAGGLVLAAWGLTALVARQAHWSPPVRWAVVLAPLGVMLLASAERPLQVGVVGAGAVGALVSHDVARDVLLRARSFYGVYRVERSASPPGAHVLVHGTTNHGLQSRVPAARRTPLTYYARAGPVGDAFAALPARVRRGQIAAVGLGGGSLACYAEPGARWTFYEIDPVIARIARDTSLFSFLADCAPDAPIVLGDARLTLARTPARRIDLLLLDAFTSDAVPVHLLTLEAFRMYASKLTPDGVLLVHVSNQYLDLSRVLGTAAAHEHWVAYSRRSDPSPSAYGAGVRAAVWVALARRDADLGALVTRPGWRTLGPSSALWTDDYSNLVGIWTR